MASSPQWSALPTRTLTNWIRLNTKRKIKQRYSPMFWQPFWISNLKLTFAPGYLTFNSKINKENLNNNINNVILPWSYNNPILWGILPKFATELNFKTNFENMFISIIWAEQNESAHCKTSKVSIFETMWPEVAAHLSLSPSKFLHINEVPGQSSH